MPPSKNNTTNILARQQQRGRAVCSRMTAAFLTVSLCISILFSATSQAEIKKTLGDWDVHYIAFTTTFLSPEIARNNNIQRSGKNALINISVLDKKTQKAQEVTMTGVARNLLGRNKPLTFKKVTEGEAIYYLATVAFSHKEVLRFDIDIKQGNISQNLKFQQTMYADE